MIYIIKIKKILYIFIYIINIYIKYKIQTILIYLYVWSIKHFFNLFFSNYLIIIYIYITIFIPFNAIFDAMNMLIYMLTYS